MSIQVIRQGDQPLYLQVAEQLRRQIETGVLAPDTRLPASRILAKRLGVNRITIVNAYAELEAEGLVISRVGSGTFVAANGDSPSSTYKTNSLPPSRGRGGLRRPRTASQMLTEMMRLAHQPGIISFAGGTSAGDFVPVNEFRRALNESLRRDGAAVLQYEEATGYLPLRETVAALLRQQSTQVSSQDILITAGCQQALDITLRVLMTGDSNVLLVEDPCYLGFLDLAISHHLTPVGVAIDENGLRTDRLEQLILRHRPQLIYVMSSFHNPTGVTMPLERRQALLEIATRYQVPILEDTSYDELRYDGKALPTLKSLDTADLVFQAGSYSKILLPGIRVGYLVVPATFRERVVAIKQTIDIFTSSLNQRALDIYLNSGHFTQHLQLIRHTYRERRDAMVAAIQRHFPVGARWYYPAGGIYLWIQMPALGPTAMELYLMAINYNVAFAIGSVFSASGSFSNAFRLNFAAYAPAEIEEGIRRLGKAWKELLARNVDTVQSNRRPATPVL